LKITSAADPAHVTCEYEVTSRDHSKGWITYELDLSDGLRITSCTLSAERFGTRFPANKLLLSEYHKVNGFWFPYRLVHQSFGETGKLVSTATLMTQDVALNVKFDRKIFEYDPPVGSRLVDEQAHTQHRVGQDQNPAKPPQG
jgi:hypothetical protein